jgi:RHS repeat-associated protein
VDYVQKGFDADLGLVRMGVRDYDPAINRFTTPDPLFLEDPELCVKRRVDCNLYTYVRGDPLGSVDPSGRFAIPLIFAACVGTSVCEVAIGVAAAGLTIVVAKAAAIFMSEKTGDGKPTTLEPGPHAGDSVPAHGPDRKWTPEEIKEVNEAGDKTGCHTCGVSTPGTKSGNWVKDHQPPTALAKPGEEQRLYPQCLACSNKQGGEVNKAKNHANMDAEAPGSMGRETTPPSSSGNAASAPAPSIEVTPEIVAPRLPNEIQLP